MNKESDMKAAQMIESLGVLSIYPGDGIFQVAVQWLKPGETAEEVKDKRAVCDFTLSDSFCLVATVQMLGEKYNICIAHTHFAYEPAGWIWEDQQIMFESEVFETYEEALRDAVMSVK